MSKKFTFLFAPHEGDGHFNASAAIGQVLLRRGHKVVFATTFRCKGKMERFGFIEEYFQKENEAATEEILRSHFNGMAETFSMPLLEKWKHTDLVMYQGMVEMVKQGDSSLRALMSKLKPDVVVLDTLCHTPALMDQGVPWVLATCFNPLGISSKNSPPAHSGYSVYGDKTHWEEYRNIQRELCKDVFSDFQSWLKENGGPKLKSCTFPFWLNYSPFANINMYPAELAYTDVRPDPPNWYRVDHLTREEEKSDFVIPKELEGGPGKLIYFSMGTNVCFMVDLMNRLLRIFADSPNRFIVSTGTLGNELILGKNMWGASWLPQPKVIPMVDLVICHGGNNSVCEAFYFGKPMVVLPAFVDQRDNGQRLEETGFGLQFNPVQVTREELLSGIQFLLEDESLTKKLGLISKRIQDANSTGKAADIVENVAINYYK